MFVLPGVRSDTFGFFFKNGRSPESQGTKKQFKKNLFMAHNTYSTIQLIIFWPENMVVVYYSHSSLQFFNCLFITLYLNRYQEKKLI